MRAISIFLILFASANLFSAEIAKSFFESDRHTLIGYWHLNENSGTTARDSSKNNNPGTLTNGTSFISAKMGYAASGGVSGGNQYIDFGDKDIFDVNYSTPFLVGMTYARSKPFDGADFVFGKVDWVTLLGWGLTIALENGTWTWDIFGKGKSDATRVGKYSKIHIATSTLDNNEHTVFVYYDGRNADNSWTICQDGKCDNNLFNDTGLHVFQSDICTANSFKAGGDNAATVEWKGGWYDEIIFSTGTWTQGEIQKLDSILRNRNKPNESQEHF